MRAPYLVLISLFAFLAFAKDTPKPVLVTSSYFRGLDASDSHKDHLEIFADGRVHYTETPAQGKEETYDLKLTPKSLQKLTALLNGKAMQAVPAVIVSQIKVIDGRTDKRFQINRGATQQTIDIENFYPQLNSHRPAYPRVLVQLECQLQEIERKAARRPDPSPEENWCPDALEGPAKKK
ncbi:MAG TPA: hypothetical protein VFR84_17540 [Candidatus Angelobacter sp.]|nr:hypothetical protein [Candidatus Angelobacter sp.]